MSKSPVRDELEITGLGMFFREGDGLGRKLRALEMRGASLQMLHGICVLKMGTNSRNPEFVKSESVMHIVSQSELAPWAALERAISAVLPLITEECQDVESQIREANLPPEQLEGTSLFRLACEQNGLHPMPEPLIDAAELGNEEQAGDFLMNLTESVLQDIAAGQKVIAATKTFAKRTPDDSVVTGYRVELQVGEQQDS